jgi:hypothetical protein
MKKNKIVVLLAIVSVLLASLACNAVSGGGTLGISNARLTSDADGKNQITTYSPSDKTFYCYFDLNNAKDTTVVKGVWTLVSAEGYDSNSEIDSAEITGGDNTYYFSLDRSSDAWPVGKYKIDLYIDNNLVQTVNFEVK